MFDSDQSPVHKQDGIDGALASVSLRKIDKFMVITTNQNQNFFREY